jgi:putative ABC transport system substrate-binding protein
LGAKRFELLHEVVPKTNLIAILTNPRQPDPGSKTDIAEVESAARAVGQQLIILDASRDDDFEPAFDALVRKGAGGLLVMADPYLHNRPNKSSNSQHETQFPQSMNGGKAQRLAG